MTLGNMRANSVHTLAVWCGGRGPRAQTMGGLRPYRLASTLTAFCSGGARSPWRLVPKILASAYDAADALRLISRIGSDRRLVRNHG